MPNREHKMHSSYRHGLQDDTQEHQILESDSKMEEDDITDFADPVPTDQAEIMKEILVTMRGIQRFMSRSSSSSSSRSTPKSGSPTRNSVCNVPVTSQTQYQAVQPQSVTTPQPQSSCPPEVSYHPVAVFSAAPCLPNLSILDAAVPSSDLPNPVSTLHDLPSSFPVVAPPEGRQQSPYIQPLNPRAVNSAQPLGSLSTQSEQCLPPISQSCASHDHQA